jgi:hypothetical protein
MGTLKAIIDQILSLLGIITSGGPSAIIAILFVDIVVMAFANYFIVRFIVNFISEQNKQRDKILAEKDQIMKDRIEKTEAIVKQYNDSQSEVVDAIRKIETAVNQNKELIMFINTQNRH